jgi:thiamine-phosphate pyrophosphorylase
MIPAGLYPIVDPTFGDPRAQIAVLRDEGLGILQLRCKGSSMDELVALATYAAAGPDAPIVVVNDHVAAAAHARAWAHVGQDDGPDPDVPFGRSTHTLDQIRRPGRAIYVGFGPIFGTTTKATRWTPRGVVMLAEAVAASPVPVVAIGGISAGNLDQVRATGVHAWAAIGAIWGAPEPRAVIRAMR